MVEPSPSRNVATTVPGADSAVISAREPSPEKETAVTWVLLLSWSGMAVVPEAFSVWVPALNVTVGEATV